MKNKIVLSCVCIVIALALLVLFFFGFSDFQYSPPESDEKITEVLPDLVVERVSSLSGQCAGGQGLSDKCFIVRAAIRNVGEVSSEKSSAFVGVTNGDGYAEKEVKIPSLMPDERYLFTVEFEIKSNFDFVSVVVADAFDSVRESDEENNVGMVR